jgi:hypothetical protein
MVKEPAGASNSGVRKAVAVMEAFKKSARIIQAPCPPGLALDQALCNALAPLFNQ